MFTWLKKDAVPAGAAAAAPLPTSKNEPAAYIDRISESLVHQTRGDQYHNEGHPEKAAECYREAISINPGNGEAFNSLGMIALQSGLYSEAEHYFEQAISVAPALAHAYYFLGCALQKQDKLDRAIENFNRARKLKPDAEIIYCDLCYALFLQGRNEAAMEAISQGIAINPDFADFHFFLGNLHGHEKQIDKAMACYQKTLALQPESLLARLNLGKMYYERQQMDEAIACYQQVLAISPDDVDTLYNLGLAFQVQKRDEATDCYRKVLALDAGHHAAKIHLLRQMQDQCDWNGMEPAILELRHAVMNSPVTDKNHLAPFTFISLSGTTAMEQKRCAERYAQLEYQHLASLRSKLDFVFDRADHKKIRIGYLSADFRLHPVTLLMAEVFELHDRSRFQVTAYSYCPDDEGPMRRRLKNAFDQFVDIGTFSYEEAARKIYADEIDVLVDLTGYTKDTRSGLLTLRPAPIQVGFLGYPGTLGMEFADYLIADRFVIPPEQLECYTERIAWLPDCFMPCDRTRPRLGAPNRGECSLPENGFVFCSFNQPYKITPNVLDIWCQLLRAVPDSVLWLPASNPRVENNLRREAENRGIAPERIIPAPKLADIDAHLARLQCADLFLDTSPFNAHSTCSDALWMGLPVVTCTGETFPSRVAGSLLTAIGVPELITRNLDDYFQLALDLATDRQRLLTVRNKLIANRDTAPLFDSKRFTRNLENLYVAMVEQHQIAPGTGATALKRNALTAEINPVHQA